MGQHQIKKITIKFKVKLGKFNPAISGTAEENMSGRIIRKTEVACFKNFVRAKDPVKSSWQVGFLFPVLFLSLLIGFCGCQGQKPSPKVEPPPPEVFPTVTPEELLSRGEAELHKFTIPGCKAAAGYFEQARQLKPEFAPAYGRLAVTYALWAKERNDLGLDNLEQWVNGYYYSLKAKEFGLEADYLKASALLSNSRNFIRRQEYRIFFSEIKNRFRKESAELTLSYLRDIFTTGEFKKETLNLPLENLGHVLDGNPEEAEALAFKSMVQLLTPDDPSLVKVMEIRPDWPLPYFLLGLFQKSRGEFQKAENWFNLTLQKNPEHPRALSELGELLFLGKKYEEAEQVLQKALALDQEMPRPHLLLGLILREKAEYEKALEHFRMITATIPDHEEALYYQSLVLVEMANWPQALESLNALVAIAGSYEIYGYSLKALCYLMLEQLSEAEADGRRALEISSSYYLPYYILGLVNFRREDWLKASQNFQQALKIDRTFDDGHYFLGQTYFKLRDLRKARAELSLAAQIFEQEIKQAEQLVDQAQAQGWARKVERLSTQKKELEVKVKNCRQLLSSL
ncbi:MAG: tetratricopeptide repeat protein [Candidatus Saccharicenans sp.]